MTKEIILTQGKSAIIDDEDFDILSQWSWTYTKEGYAYRQQVLNGKKMKLFMHRFLLPTDLEVDHINGNRLDNRKDNLRPSNRSQNMANRKKPLTKNAHSKYKGVFLSAAKNKWVSQICVNYKRIHLGTFKNEEDAATAYNFAAIKYFGEFANLNQASAANA